MRPEIICMRGQFHVRIIFFPGFMQENLKLSKTNLTKLKALFILDTFLVLSCVRP